MGSRYLALGLTGRQVLQLLDDGDLTSEWDALPLAFTVLAIDRLDGRPAGEQTIDSSAAAAVLAGRTKNARFLIAASPRRDHPYNLARRIASLGHLSAGRSGAVFGAADSFSAPGNPWGVDDTSEAVNAVQLAAEAAVSIRALEQSWPLASVVGDRDTGIFVRSDEIGYVDVDGHFQITGPLTVPEPPGGPSVLGWFADAHTDGAPGIEQNFDLVFGGLSGVHVVDVSEKLPPDNGVLLSPSDDIDVADVLDIARQLLADKIVPVTPSGGLREVLAIATPARQKPHRPAFPVPQPHPPGYDLQPRESGLPLGRHV